MTQSSFTPTKSTIDHGKPYAACPSGGANDWWYVADCTGFNCLTFLEKPGACFTSEEHAHLVAALWNGM